jgi:RNA-directed DNA polymerase
VGKRNRPDVQTFQIRLFENIFSLHRALQAKTYSHSGYQAFKISDPKPRDIHKATVRDRLLHHALYRQLYPFFDRTFIADSYSCRNRKGTHRAMMRLRTFATRVSRNNTRTVWVLKCDIRKFFASIDHDILLRMVSRAIPDTDINWLVSQVVRSFHSTEVGKGLPLGNLTSQLLVNIYLHEFDLFVKHALRAKHYIRYADDFVILSEDRVWLESLCPRIADFLQSKLRLKLHPHKVRISTVAAGVDFLGWVHFSDHRVLRTTTKRRMRRRLAAAPDEATIRSYQGMLLHGNAWKVGELIGQSRI